jgi:hypothetical protein
MHLFFEIQGHMIDGDFLQIDIATLRSKHHMCGVLTGTLPHLSQQNVFLGVPLILMPEEVVLLVENGAFQAPLVNRRM